MPIEAGVRIGPYEVVSLLGAGGMGEVYRARDTALHREVAIKVLPDHFAADGERLARFTREAQTLAALNHPNIAHVHGLESSSGWRALVMELVEGEDLAQPLARGPLPVDEALAVAWQVAEALEAAHEQGIVHRDLKPANIKLRADGVAKVLDFGLAKAFEPAGGDAASSQLANSPTITSPAMTVRGMILGTAAYMAPEQAKGKPVDKRADVWSFGCVLFEMLTGGRAFQGDDVSTTLAAVLLKEPDWAALPAATPVGVRGLLERCLTKDPKARLRDIGEARIRIDEVIRGQGRDVAPPTHPPGAPERRWHPAWLVGGVAAVAALVAAVAALRPATEAPVRAVRFAIPPPDETFFGGPVAGGTGNAPQLAVSPDGQSVVFVGRTQSTYQLWLRPLATLEARPIPGTVGGTFPFWSPDGRFVAFFADGKLKKVPLDGGPAVVLCDAPSGRGGSWSRDDVIVFSPTGIGTLATGLLRVPASGGEPAMATTIDAATGETHHRWPHFQPDGRHFLYTASTGACCPPPQAATIRIGSIDAAEATTTLFEAESAVYYASGHLVFARDERLMAQPFDPDRRQKTGEPFPIADHVASEGSRYTSASVSTTGALVYAAGSGAVPGGQLTWFDRAGRALGTVGDAAPFVNLALSPDAGRVAVAISTGNPGNLDVWVLDVARNLRSRLTFDPGADGSPVWSPDGTRVAFQNLRGRQVSIRQAATNGSGGEVTLFDGSTDPARLVIDAAPTDWSADGRYIAYTQRTSATTSDLYVLPLDGNRTPIAVANDNGLETSGAFSPDGRWIAYTATDSGQPNVFVQAFPGPGAKYQVTRDGGGYPLWRADGKEIFYLAPDATLTAVPVERQRELTFGAPQPLFQTQAQRLSTSRIYGVTKDGQRFLFNNRLTRSVADPLTVVLNWTTAIQR